MKIFTVFLALLALAACKDTTSSPNLNDKADLVMISVVGEDSSFTKHASEKDPTPLR